MKTKHTYLLVSIGCILSYIWIIYCFTWKNNSTSADPDYHVCLFKQMTGLPCPSCGTSRSVIRLIQGDFEGAVRINPLGILAAILLVTAPLWMMADLVMSQPTLVRSFLRIEYSIKTKTWIWAPMLILITANWIWNILKGV